MLCKIGGGWRLEDALYLARLPPAPQICPQLLECVKFWQEASGEVGLEQILGVAALFKCQ